jgi:hypothetical protein
MPPFDVDPALIFVEVKSDVVIALTAIVALFEGLEDISAVIQK